MTDEQKNGPEPAPGDDGSEASAGAESGADEAGARTGRQSFGDGIRQGMGVLAAFKDALEETIQEARDRGDLSSEKAREVMKDALDRAQTAAEGARERLDFATQNELHALRSAVESLAARVATLEEAAGIEPVEPDTSSEEEARAEEA